MLLFLYRLLFILCTPLIWGHIASRARAGKEDPGRVNERYGIASDSSPLTLTLSPQAGRGDSSALHVPPSPLWIHAASVGEATAALTVADIARTIDPNIPMLITTGTVTSAHVVARRLPPNTVHQYAPYDHPVWVARFLNHWTPRASIRIESELWPTMCLAVADRHIPTLLLNAHLSARSFKRWQYFPRTAHTILSAFTHILANGEANATRFNQLGARRVTSLPNLKFIADPLPVDPAGLVTFKSALNRRPVWMYASTHADEETIAAHAHIALKPDFPNLLTIIALRHPGRIDDVIAALAPLHLKIERRTHAQTPAPDTDIYIVDTMGDLGLFFAVCPVAMVGRSFSRDGGGGHNPIEPALFGCYPLSGPHVQNLTTIYDPMVAARACDIIATPDDLAPQLRTLLADAAGTKDKGKQSSAFIYTEQNNVKTAVHQAMTELLKM